MISAITEMEKSTPRATTIVHNWGDVVREEINISFSNKIIFNSLPCEADFEMTWSSVSISHSFIQSTGMRGVTNLNINHNHHIRCTCSRFITIITPHACARGKIICLFVYRCHRRHENHHISPSRHLCVL